VYSREATGDEYPVARDALGEQAHQAAYRYGWELTLDEAVSYALGAEPVPPPPAEATGLTQLTRREREVAELIAQGLSNREIAARLFISRRTAESHAENILRKLGFTSRARVAAWVVDHRG
jgi:non-specific serine/threonine protein kinase